MADPIDELISGYWEELMVSYLDEMEKAPTVDEAEQQEPKLTEEKNQLAAIFLEKGLRVIGTVKEPLFYAVDVATYIGDISYRAYLTKYVKTLPNPDEYVRKIDDRNHGGIAKKMWFLTEKGLYRYLMRSNREKAVEFQEYVYDLLRREREHCTDRILAMEKERADTLESINTDLKKGIISLEEALQKRSKLRYRCPKRIERPLALGCLYFVGYKGFPHLPVKIGFTACLRRRFSNYETHNFARMVVLRSIVVANPREVEKKAHAQFSGYHVKGEWYRVTQKMIDAFVA